MTWWALLLSLVYAKTVGGLIAWHTWRAGRTTGRRRLRHAAALVQLARVSQRQADRLARQPREPFTPDEVAW